MLAYIQFLQPEVVIPFFAIIGILFLECCFRYVLNYKIGKTAIYVMLFRLIPIMKFSYSKIVDIRPCTLHEAMPYNFFTLRAGNRFWGNYVMIIRKGFFKKTIITPDNSKEFLKEVKLRMRELAFI